MIYLLLLAGGLALVLLAAYAFAYADPRRIAQHSRIAVGAMLLLLAGLFAFTGRILLAVPLALAAGLVMLSPARSRRLPGGPRPDAPRPAERTSRFRAPMIELELAHGSGVMHGRVLAGAHRGTELGRFDPPTLIGLRADLDEESRALLDAYLDSRETGWREHVEEDARAGLGEPPGHSPMREEEAYQIMGLERGASTFDVRRAHRILMKRLHPDRGGSAYLAVRVNQAKDILLRRHR